MNSINKPIVKRQLLITGSGIALSFLVAYFLGFSIGFIACSLSFAIVILYTKRMDKSIHRSNLVNYRRDVNFSKYNAYETKRPRYVCLSCGASAKDAQCSECGSKIRKPLF
jgi:hypothetical protein